jgi:DNA-binding NtrC family response regulator
MTSDPTVLIVDDEEPVLASYEDMLAGEYTVRSANSGSAALEIVDQSIDVVLLDRRMPGMSGDIVLEEIRSRGVDCRVVLVTAVDPDIDIIDMDFDDYLTKPVTGDQLHDAVDRMCKRDEFETQIQEMISLAFRIATLQSKLEFSQLEESEQYADLQQQFSELREETSFPVSEEPYFETSLERIEALIQQTR